MFVELAAAIENAGGSLKAPDRLNEVQDVRELLTVVDRVAAASRRDTPRLRLEPEKDDEIHVPEPLRIVGNKVVEIAQRALYERILRTKYEDNPTFRITRISLSRRIINHISIWDW